MTRTRQLRYVPRGARHCQRRGINDDDDDVGKNRAEPPPADPRFMLVARFAGCA